MWAKQNPGRVIGSPLEGYRDGSGVFVSRIGHRPIMSNGRPWQWYEARLSPARLAHYLAEAGGDGDKAIALYEWNASVSAAFWEEFSYFEVAFRNALDSRMTARHSALGRPSHWIFDDARELGRDARGAGHHNQPYRDVAEAIRRVRGNRKPTAPGQVISEISFGFWHQLVSKRHVAFWPDLAGAFPNAPRRDQALVREPVARLRDFRNRIGHHHRIWALDILSRHEDLTEIAAYIDVDLPDWIETNSRVGALVAVRPV